MKWKMLLAGMVAAGTLTLPGTGARASSHSDAPLIKLDPQANLTDVYAFIRQPGGPGNQKFLVVEVSVRPFSEPGDGPMYDVFSDDARYSIHITNPTTGAEVQRYDFQFSRVSGTGGNYKNRNTILRYGRGTDTGDIENVGDDQQNFVQTYRLTRSNSGGTRRDLGGGMRLLVPPYNAGARTTPFYNDKTGTPATNPDFGKAVSGAATRAALDRYTAQTTYTLPGGQLVFAGSREDGFYADVPGIFDFLDPRILDNDGTLFETLGTFPALGQDGNGVDGFKGFNVLHYGIAIPVEDLPTFEYTGAFQTGTANGVGVFASVSRPRVTLRSAGGENQNSDDFVQVNRLANPLFNEVLVAMRDKDRYNRQKPTGDAQFAKYALNPEIAVLINDVYRAALPAPLVTTGRADLAAVYIPDVVRVDTTTGPTTVAGAAGFNRLSFLGGDTIADSSGTQIPAGWPNGRRFGDDVVDIALTAVASGPSYTSIVVVGDNVDANDQAYNQVFPYAGTPHAGSRHSKDSGVNDE